MAKRIYLCLAHMSGKEQAFIQEAFDTNWVVPLGPNVNGFEEDLKKFVERMPDQVGHDVDGAGHDVDGGGRNVSRHCRLDRQSATVGCPVEREVVSLSSGTAAVHLGLLACGVGPGDEVLVQSFTFCASSHPVTYLGATPVFIDSEKESWNMDPDLLEEAIKDRIAKTGRVPKAIVPVAQ